MPKPLAKLRVLIADDHELVRRGIRGLLASKVKCRIVGESKDGAEAVEQAKSLQPDIVILDIDMPNLNGLEAAPRIREAAPRTKIIVLTLHESAEVVKRAISAGAEGLVLKSDMAAGLVMAVRQVSHDKPFQTSRVSDIVSRDLLRTQHSDDDLMKSPAEPTSRESEVIRLLSSGKTNKEIAAALGISIRTAELHRANIMKRLGLHSLAELVHYAIRTGLTTPNLLERGKARTFRKAAGRLAGTATRPEFP